LDEITPTTRSRLSISHKILFLALPFSCSKFLEDNYINFTMKYTLFLLALVVGSVVGIDEFNAMVTGDFELNLAGHPVRNAGSDGEVTCAPCVMNALFDRCVLAPAVARGAVLDTGTSRRELRGNRRLCPSYCPAQRYVGQWCWVKCGGGRRLTFADEVSSERSLFEASDLIELQIAAQKCYQERAVNFPCLGLASDIEVTVYQAPSQV
jgi:hypothetical protein